jgi:hypothetical protein
MIFNTLKIIILYQSTQLKVDVIREINGCFLVVIHNVPSLTFVLF